MTPQSSNRIHRSIALIGYRGCGKTTVGRKLATMLEVPFVDTDETIIKAAGKSISEIFADDGETQFRDLEKRVIGALKATPPSIISVGGGAVKDTQNVAIIRSVAMVVWLTAPADVLADRVLADSQSLEMRPALTDQSPRDEVECVLRDRNPLYEKAADHTINTEGRTPTEIASSISTILRT